MTPHDDPSLPEASLRRTHLPPRHRLMVAAGLAGLAGVVSAVSVAALLRPTAEPAGVHADSAPVAVTDPGRFSPAPQIPVSVEPSTARPSLTSSWLPPVSPAPTTAPATVTVLPVDQERGLRSVVSDRETQIKFVNHRDEPVVINWLDYQGARERYGILAAGGVREQVTYLNHPWVITDLRGRSLAVLLPTTRPAQATIT